MGAVISSVAGEADGEELLAALEHASEANVDPFVIIEGAGQHFMQCLCKPTGWLLEKREGDETRHHRAFKVVTPTKSGSGEESMMARILAPQNQPNYNLTYDEVVEAMLKYLNNQEEPEWLKWERFDCQ